MATHKNVWVANDGTEFPTEVMAERHEAIITCREEISTYLHQQDLLNSFDVVDITILFRTFADDARLRDTFKGLLLMEEFQAHDWTDYRSN